MARKKIQNWVAVGILFFVLVAMVITGFGTGGTGGLGSLSGGGAPSASEIAKVGGVAITADQVNNQFNQDFQQLRQNLPNATILEFLNQGGLEGSVERLVALEALRQYAQTRGIVATRAMVDNAIATSPEFQFAHVGGTFDNNIFQTALQRASISEQQIREEYGRRLLQQQLLVPMISGATMPQSVAQAYATVPMEQRSGVIGVVPAGAIERTLNPSEAEIAAYYQRYRDYFTIPERRAIKYALIGADQVTITPVTDAEIQTVYNNTPRYQAGQIRTLESVNFGLAGSAQADATAFVARVRGGASFQQAAQAAGRAEAYARRANQSQRDFANLVTPEVSAQAFTAQQGAIIGPVRSQLGWLVVRVETAAAGQALTSVRADILRELERRKRTAAINALATRLEQQIEDGKSFEDVATGAHLTVVTSPPITAQGRLSNGQAATIAPELRTLLPAAFEIDADDSTPQIASIEENARYALIGIERSEAAAPPPLAEIRDLVRTQLVRRTALRNARQIADAIAARINGGMAPAQAFAQAGLPLPPPQPISTTRSTVMSQQVPESLRLFFRLRPGTAAVVAAPNNAGWMVAAPQQSTRATTASPQAATSARMQLGQVTQEEAQWQILKAMEASVGVQRNNGAIRAERRRIQATMTVGPQQQ